MEPAPPHEYQALTAGVGMASLPGRTLVELTRADRQTFLHNFCTNDVRGLKPGEGCEAFITSVQGKIIAHVIISCETDRLVLDTVPGQAERIIAHLDKYLIREQVMLADRTAEWGELLLAGSSSTSVIAGALPQAPGKRLGCFNSHIAGHDVKVQSIDMVGPVGFLVRAAEEHLDEISAALVAAGAVRCSAATVETARIEAGWPLYGRDVTEHNLPQEVARDTQAISFTKGCYLGQETVARIDALGHVNRTLCGLRFSGSEIPVAGTPLSAEDKPAGEVTSATFSPRLGAPLALGYVRRGHNAIGTRLSSPAGEAEVVRLPLS